MKSKGFTLIELLATLVILGIIMLVAIPSTVSMLEKNKKDTYISDAKRLVALAENEIKNNDSLDVSYNGIIVFPFKELDDGSFENDPDSTGYNDKTSFVIAHKKGNVDDYQFVYYVQLLSKKRGISLSNYKYLERDDVNSVPELYFDVGSSDTSGFTSFLNSNVSKIDGFSMTNDIVYYCYYSQPK